MFGKKNVSREPVRTNEAVYMGEELSFAAKEAYKRLRTNIDFCVSKAEKACRIIGVTSSVSGEGKSTTSINLAYTMAQTENKVLLIDGDMRLPTVGTRLGAQPSPGLSNLLVGQCSSTEAVQQTKLAPNVYIITAGDLPPNPSELIGSERIKKMLDELSESFDVIIMDLPPVVAVSDAVATSKYLDGVLIVVRENYCDRKSLHDTVSQLRFSKTKILGFVMTDSKIQKRAYKKYGKSYGNYG